MANASTTGFGLRTVTTLGNTPATAGLSNYKVKSGLGVGIFKNNPVSLQDSAGDQGYLQDASFATTDDTGTGGASYTNASHALLVGVFNGIFYIDNTTSKPVFSNSVAASTTFGTDYNTGSTDGIAFVNDNSQQEYVVKADNAVTQAMIGTSFNVNNFTASDASSGQSTVTLNITGAAETKMFRVVRSADDPENNDLTAAGANIVVAYNAASNLYQ
jgi:hypothetical protein